MFANPRPGKSNSALASALSSNSLTALSWLTKSSAASAEGAGAYGVRAGGDEGAGAIGVSMGDSCVSGGVGEWPMTPTGASGVGAAYDDRNDPDAEPALALLGSDDDALADDEAAVAE